MNTLHSKNFNMFSLAPYDARKHILDYMHVVSFDLTFLLMVFSITVIYINNLHADDEDDDDDNGDDNEVEGAYHTGSLCSYCELCEVCL